MSIRYPLSDTPLSRRMPTKADMVLSWSREETLNFTIFILAQTCDQLSNAPSTQSEGSGSQQQTEKPAGWGISIACLSQPALVVWGLCGGT